MPLKSQNVRTMLKTKIKEFINDPSSKRSASSDGRRDRFPLCILHGNSWEGGYKRILPNNSDRLVSLMRAMSATVGVMGEAPGTILMLLASSLKLEYLYGLALCRSTVVFPVGV